MIGGKVRVNTYQKLIKTGCRLIRQLKVINVQHNNHARLTLEEVNANPCPQLLNMKLIIIQTIPFLFLFASQYYLAKEKYKIGWIANVISSIMFLFVNVYFELYIFALAQLPLIFFAFVALLKVCKK